MRKSAEAFALLISWVALTAGFPSAAKDFETLPSDGIPYEYSTDQKVVMSGDLHGNLEALTRILRDSDLIDRHGHWTGGRSLFVSPGDILDGDKDSVLVVNYIVKLKKEAQKAGGDVVTTYGNHEIMVSEGDVLHVTKQESHFYADMDPGAHEKNSIHEFFFPDNERGAWMRSLNQVVKVRQEWKELDSSGKWVTKSRTFIAVHAGLSDQILDIPFDRYNATARGWIRYWQYRARTKALLKAQLDKKDVGKKTKAKLKGALKDLEKNKLAITDEAGLIVPMPPKNTAWVVGYDPKTGSFDTSAVNSPSWARFNRIALDKKTGEPVIKADPGAPTPAEFDSLLAREGADFMVVGHEPTPRDAGAGVIREVRSNPRYKTNKLINLDTRIGWVSDPKVAGTVSYATMTGGEVAFHNDLPGPTGPTELTRRMQRGARLGLDCASKKFLKLLENP